MGVANAKAGGWQADLAMMPVTMGAKSGERKGLESQSSRSALN